MSEKPNAKVLFRVPGEGDSATVETLWATSLGNDFYKLDNSPFYAYGVSWEDVVLAPFDDYEQMASFKCVVTKSGNRTVRIIFDPPVSEGNESDRLLQGLVALGCSYEGANPGYISVNIPEPVVITAVREYLISTAATWEHADPTYDELFPDVA